MSRDGSGTYNLPAGQPVVTGTTISSTTFNTLTSDLAAALTASLASDGQTNPTANLPMNTHRHTGVGNSAARTDYASAADVQDGTLIYLTSVAGTNTITATAPNTMAAYVAGQRFSFIVAVTNTSTVTLNINGIGAKAITKSGANALDAGDMVAAMMVEMEYDGTQFQLLTSRMGKVAASGYTRVTPNYCRKNSIAAIASWTAVIGNISVAAPTGATLVVVNIWMIANVNTTTTISATDSSYSTIYDEALHTAGSGTVNGASTAKLFAPVSGGNFYLSPQTGSCYYAIVGYYD